MARTERLTAEIPTALAGERLDKALAVLMPTLSRRLARKILAMGAVHLDGRPVRRASAPVQAGQRLQATFHPDVLTPERFDLTIVYEDADFVVVDKPPGQLSQGSELGDVGSLIHALTRRFGPDIRLMHRLDKGASGLLVAARHPRASAHLTPQFRDHTIARRYLAIAAGLPAEGPCRLPLFISGREARLARPGEDGVPAESHVAPLTTWQAPDGTLRTQVAVTLTTGKTHQIRIHLAALGAPIVGDPAYGGPTAPRLCLHAETLGFTSLSGELLAFSCPPGPAFGQAGGIPPPP